MGISGPIRPRNLFSLCPVNEIPPRRSLFEANTFPTKPQRLKAREFPADASVSLPGRGPCPWRLRGARAAGARGHLSSPAAWCTAQGGCVSFAAWGRQRVKMLLRLPPLFSPACPKPLPRSLVSLAFPLCLALCPQEPTQLFRGLWGSPGTPLFTPEAVSVPGSSS